MGIENPNPITYADWAKTRDPDGNTADVVELLAKTNPIITDAMVIESNREDGHQSNVRSGIPRGTWRKLNYGVMPTKTQQRQVMDHPGMLENYIEVDKDLADKEADRAAFMLQESEGIVQGLNIDHCETLIYGDTDINPDRFMGFASRYNDAYAESAANILNGFPGTGGAVSTLNLNTSIYIMTWGRSTMFEIFPKGSKVGLQIRDLGEQTLFDANGGRFQGYRSHFQHKVGFVLRDWRYGVRIANLDTAELLAGGIDLIKLLIKGVNRIQSPGMGQTVIYANRNVVTALDIAANEKANAALAMREWGTEMVPAFRGFPIRMVESISSAEADITGLPSQVA